MPLAELCGGVAGVLQAGGDGGFLVEAVERGAVVVEIEAALEASGHDAAARGNALRSGAVAVGGDHAAAGEGIEMGGFDVVDDAMDAEVGVAVVVRVDEDDVGLCR